MAQFDRFVAALETKYRDPAEHLEAARDDLLAFTAYPREIWRQIWSNNRQERLNKKIRRRTDVVRILADSDALIRPVGAVGAVLAEQSDEWTKNRRYMSRELLPNCPIRIANADPNKHAEAVVEGDRDKHGTNRLSFL